MPSINSMTIIGGALTMIGIISFAVPMFTTSQTRNVANIGDLKLQTTESTSYTIPPMASAAALAAGVALLGFGLARSRN